METLEKITHDIYLHCCWPDYFHDDGGKFESFMHPEWESTRHDSRVKKLQFLTPRGALSSPKHNVNKTKKAVPF